MRFSTRTVGDRVGNAVKRVTIEKTNDDPLFREAELSLFTQEKQKEIEHFEPYGLTSRVKPPSQAAGGGGGGGSGGGGSQEQKKAEGLMVFTGGNRSHGALLVVGDRRFRIKGMKEGEVALFDDQGHQVHLTRAGIVVSAPSGKNIVSQIMGDEKAPKATSGQGDAKNYGQAPQAGKNALTSLTLDKDAWTVKHPTKISFTVGNSTLVMQADSVTITSPAVTVTATQGANNINGKPINLNGGGPVTPAFTVPG